MPQENALRNPWGLGTTACDYEEDTTPVIFLRGHTYVRPVQDMASEVLRNYRSRYADWASAGISEYLRVSDFVAQMNEPRKVEFPNMDWFLQNFDRLAVEYPDRWLAIVNRRVVANAETPAKLRELIRANGIHRPFVAHASRRAWGRTE